MKKSNPYWYKLIKLLKQKDKIGTGLTIPYIYGAYEILGIPFSNISELLEEIYRIKIDKCPVLHRCNVSKEFVISVENKAYYNRGFIKAVKLYNKDRNNYLVISPTANLGNTLEKVSLKLKAQYMKLIQDGNYSWNKDLKKWGKFEENEIELIMSIK